MPLPIRPADPFDPTRPAYPACDSLRQPCRALLTDILVLQANKPGKSPAAQAEIARARKRLLHPRRGAVPDENACWDSLRRIEAVMRDLYLGEDGWMHLPGEFGVQIWERLESLMPSTSMDGVLADLDDR